MEEAGKDPGGSGRARGEAGRDYDSDSFGICTSLSFYGFCSCRVACDPLSSVPFVSSHCCVCSLNKYLVNANKIPGVVGGIRAGRWANGLHLWGVCSSKALEETESRTHGASVGAVSEGSERTGHSGTLSSRMAVDGPRTKGIFE